MIEARYLQRKTAKVSPIYQGIIDTAMNHLTLTGTFRKAQIVEECQLEGFEGSIRWDYVREFLQEANNGTDLIPVAESYFSYRVNVDGVMVRNTPQLQERIPERFIAAGHGKKTAGYALVEPKNGHLVLVVARIKDARANGTKRSADKFRADATQRNALGSDGSGPKTIASS